MNKQLDLKEIEARLKKLNIPLYLPNPRGWVVKYYDGRIIPEWKFGKGFSHLPDQDQIEAVALVWGNKRWVYPNKKGYYAAKSESVLLGGDGFAFRILEKRSIGYWENQKKVQITLDEFTGKITGPYEVTA